MKNKKPIDERWKTYNLDYALDHEKTEPENSYELKEVLKLHNPDKNDDIVEIGCNTGEFCYLLHKTYNVNPLGIDINNKAIEVASNKYSNLNFKVKDIFELDGKYDVIYMLHLIEHLEKPEDALSKLNEILSDNGKLILTCPNKWAYLTKFLYWIIGEKFCYDPTHLIEYDPSSLSKILKRTGFQPLKIRTRPLGIPYISRISPYVQYSIPAYLFGNYINILAKKV